MWSPYPDDTSASLLAIEGPPSWFIVEQALQSHRFLAYRDGKVQTLLVKAVWHDGYMYVYKDGAYGHWVD